VVKRTTKIVTVIFGALIASVAILLGALVYQLTQGPISLSFLTPYLEPALNDNDLGADVSLDDTILTWNRDSQALELMLINVAIHDEEGELMAAFPRLQMGLSGLALTRGMLAPTFVAVRGLNVRVVRREDGTLSLAVVMPRSDRTEERDETDLLAELLDEPDRSKSSGWLTEITVRDAGLIYEDRRAGALWPMEVGELTLRRDDEGVTVEMTGDVIGASPDDRWPVVFTAGYSRAFDLVTAEATIDRVTIGQIARRIESMNDYSGVTVPVRGTAITSYQLADGPRDFSITLDIGTGAIKAASLFDEPVVVESGTVEGRFDWISGAGEISKLTLTNGAFAMAAQGTFALQDEGADIDLRGKFDALSIDDLKRYWPKGAGEGARVWVVENMKGGVIRDADFKVTVPASVMAGKAELAKDGIDVQFRLEDGAASVLGDLPWLTQARATAHLTAHTFKMDIAHAIVGPNTLKEGYFLVRDLRVKGGDSDVRLVLYGQLPDVLTMIDQNPLNLPTKMGLDPKSFEGETATRLHMVVPLRKEAGMDQLQFAVVSNLRKVKLPDFVPGFDMRDAEFELRSDGRTMSAKGELSINGVRALASWHENFEAPEGEPGSIYRGSLATSSADRAQLGFDLQPWLDGPVPLNLEVKARGGHIFYVDIDANLRNAALAVEPLDWVKQPGAPSQLSLRFVPQPGGGLNFPAISVKGPGHEVSGAFDLDVNGMPVNARFDRLILDQAANASFTLTTRPDGSYDGTIEGAFLRLPNPLSGEDDEDAPDLDDDPVSLPDFKGRIAFEHVQVGEGLVLHGLIGSAQAEDGLFAKGHFDATLEDGKSLRAKLEPIGAGQRELKILTENAGAVMEGLGLIDNAKDGTMTIGMTLSHDAQNALVFNGGIKAQGLRIVKLPALAQILNLSSLSGIAGALQGDGLLFETVEIPFVTRPDGIRIDDARAIGPSVGIHFRGLIGDDGTLDLGGTVAPAYTLNSLIGYVPIIGELLMGGEGQGLIAVNFTARGPTDNVSINANPLSALTPGFLRGIFGTPGKDKNKDQQARAPQPAPRPAPRQPGDPDQPASSIDEILPPPKIP